jgi:hypothetical protein
MKRECALDIQGLKGLFFWKKIEIELIGSKQIDFSTYESYSFSCEAETCITI